MCGILGAVAHNAFGPSVRPWVERGLVALNRRGPDSGGLFLDRNIVLGARRLRIHDLDTRSDQPFFNADKSRVLVFNGAIFNYKDLREELRTKGHRFATTSDTEVAMVAIDEWGTGAFSRFDGMFAIAHLDRESGRLLLVRDRLGIKPLYFYQSRELFAFASEIKPLLAHPDIPRALNRQSLPEFVAFQNVMPPHTLFEGIDVLLPGHYFEMNIGQDSLPARHAYWRMDSETMNPQNAPDLEESLITSLEQCWNADRDVGIQLSGGVDSSLVTALSTEVLGRRDVQTYSVIFDDSRIRYYTPRSEEKYIQEVVNRYHVDNESYLFTREQVRPAFAEAVWYLESPLHGPSTCLYMLLAKALRDRVTVLLTGEGADDIFLGYFNDWDFTDEPRDLFKMFVGADSISALFGSDGLDAALQGRLSLAGSSRLLDMTRLQRATVITVETVLHGLLARHDRMFMSQSIEGRPPFCTDLMVQARFGMADEDVHGKRGGKLAIKRLTERYFESDFVYRKKIGFSSPFGDWCSDPLWWRDYIGKLNIDFLDDLMDTAKLRATLAMPESESKWSGQNLNLLFTIANLQLWHEIFIQSADPLCDAAWQDALPPKIREELS